MKISASTTLAVGMAVAACTGDRDMTANGPLTWSLSAEPVLSIGVLQGDEQYLFQNVANAVLLEDGRIVVADDGFGALRVYGPDGEFLSQIGGPGEGPGEFQSISGMWTTPGNEVVVCDLRSLRMTRFEMDGTVVSTTQLVPSGGEELPGGSLSFIGVFGDGSIGVGFLRGGGRLEPGRIATDEYVLGRFGPDGVFLGTIGVETYFDRTGFSGGGGGPVAFSPIPYVATHGDSLYFADGLRPEIQVRDRDGNVGRVIPLDVELADVAAAMEALKDRLDTETEARYEPELVDEIPRPASIPSIGGLFVDRGGHLWVREYDVPDDALWLPGGFQRLGGSWSILDGSGDGIATVGLPAGVKPLDVRGDRLLGLSFDEFDVQRLVVHAIER